MTLKTKKTTSTKSHRSPPHVALATDSATPTRATMLAPTASAGAIGATATTSSSAAAPIVFVNPPPPGTKMPTPPDDYVPATPGEFKAVVPRQAELSAMPQAIVDLGNFTSYAAILGATAPPLAEVKQSFIVGGQWSTMRQGSSRWDGYASLQEGLAWRTIRAQMAALQPAFALAANRDPSLAERFPGLAKLLGAKKDIAQKGAASRKANVKAIAEGKLPSHGVVGRRRQRAAEKASLATPKASTTASAPAPSGVAGAAPVQGGTTTAQAPVVAAPPAEGGGSGTGHA